MTACSLSLYLLSRHESSLLVSLRAVISLELASDSLVLVLQILTVLTLVFQLHAVFLGSKEIHFFIIHESINNPHEPLVLEKSIDDIFLIR